MEKNTAHSQEKNNEQSSFPISLALLLGVMLLGIATLGLTFMEVL